MKKITFIILASIAFISCNKISNKKEVFDSFDFSYNGVFTESFSIKFTGNDTVYVRQYWTINDLQAGSSSPYGNTSYIGRLNKTESEELLNYLTKINFQKFRNEYNEDYEDGDSYSLNIRKNALDKTILVHSNNPPDEIAAFSKWILTLKGNLKLEKSSKKIHFESVKDFLPPPPPEPK